MRIPAALTLFRAAAGPSLLAAEVIGIPGVALASIVMLAFISDYFDGVIARQLGVATDRLRLADSIADTVFYICAAIALMLRAPEIIKANLTSIVIIIALEVIRQILERYKYGRMAAYHMWSAKVWGVTLVLGFIEAFVTGAPGPLFRAAVIMGVIADIEGLCASITLSSWHHDVPSLWHAMRIQRSEAFSS